MGGDKKNKNLLSSCWDALFSGQSKQAEKLSGIELGELSPINRHAEKKSYKFHMEPLIRSVYRRYLLHYGCTRYLGQQQDDACLNLIRSYFSAMRYPTSNAEDYLKEDNAVLVQPATDLYDRIRVSEVISDEKLFKFLDSNKLLLPNKDVRGPIQESMVVGALQEFLESESQGQDRLMTAVLRHVNILQEETDDLYRFCFALATDILERNSARRDERGVKDKSKAKKASTFFNKMKGDARQVSYLAKRIYIKFTQKLVHEATAKAQKGAENARGENSGLETERSDFSQLKDIIKDIIKEKYAGKLSYYYKSRRGELHIFYSKNPSLANWFNDTIKGLKIDMDEVSVDNKQAFVESVADACLSPVGYGNSIIEEMIDKALLYNRPESDEVNSTTPGIR